MDYDEQQVLNAVLALLVPSSSIPAVRGNDMTSLTEALHVQGLITNPRGHGESARLTNEGLSTANALAVELFGTKPIR